MVASEIKKYLNRDVKFVNSPKSRRKLTDDNFFIPSIGEAETFAKYNYNVAQLKVIARHYKLPVSGNKNHLYTVIYNFLELSSKVITIQKWVRGYFARKVVALRGPGLKERSVCNNQCDFLTLTEINEIPFDQFFSFKCEKGFIYGFDIVSLYQMFTNTIKSSQRRPTSINNPYTRDSIGVDVFYTMKKIKKLSSLFGMNTQVLTKTSELEPEIQEEEFNYEQRIMGICQSLDSFGNYTDVTWFTELSRSRMVAFVRELYDIWNYRAQLSFEMKREICPPNGNPFSIVSNNAQGFSIFSEDELRKIFVKIIEKIISSANDASNRSLGGMYVLTALTTVSNSAALAMPWLYESVMN